MLKNYFKTAFRSLWREKGSSLINISGLTLGITSSIVLFLIITHYASFDDFHSKRDRVYRLVHQSKGNNGMGYSAGVPAVLPEAFKNDFPEAEEVVFISYRSGSLISVPQSGGAEPKRYNEDNGVAITQPSFFKTFDRKILIGSEEKGLDDPNEAVISKKSALRYFGREEVVGESVIYDNIEYKITAVMEDYPSNTDFPFNLLLSYATVKKALDEHGWNSIWSDEQCYFLLKENEQVSHIQTRIPDFIKKYYGDRNDDQLLYFMQPLSELHFDERFNNFSYNTTPRTVLFSLGVIALFLVLTACINFINLTTAEAIKRSKEVGIRKSLGSSRKQLVFQFLGETSLVSLIAIGLSLVGTQVSLFFLNPFLELSLKITADPVLWFFIVFIFLFVSVLSGLYPSFVVSAYNPVLALKNLVSNKNSSGYNLRRSLVVMQFFISQFFIIGTIALIRQIDFFEKTDLGFAKDAVVTVPIPVEETPAAESKSDSKMRTLKNEILTISGVEKASLNSTPPSSGSVSSTNFSIDADDQKYGAQVKQVDGDYVDLFKLNIVDGKSIADQDTATGFLVNEKLVSTLGFKSNEEILGKQMKMWGKRLPVVGVIKNFHTVSLSQAVEPVVILNRIRGYERLSLKINTSDMQNTVKEVQKKWEAAYPDFIFSYEFLDEDIRGFYEGERKMSTMLTIFSSLAIFIGCLGLFGLAAFMANQKTKEIGVRKVLGASVESIVFLFTKEFIKLIIIGFLFAAPAAWYIMNEYLSQFAYKITIGPLIFVLSLGVTFLIAMFTVGFKSFRAATVNPAQSLRSE
jgi:putative ABC transport system permease protein